MSNRIRCFAAAAAMLAGATVLHPAHAGVMEGVRDFQTGRYAEALKQLEPEAAKGNTDALFILGEMHSAGKGVERDQAKAAELYGKAAELGHAKSMQNYGEALMLGEGVAQDIQEALKWFILSARAGNNDAAAYASRVGKFSTREMQSEARMKALDWEKAFKAKKDGAK